MRLRGCQLFRPPFQADLQCNALTIQEKPHSMIPCSGYFRVERGYEIEKSIFNLIIGKSEGIDIEFRIEILDGQIATLVNHRDRSGGVGCTWKYIINQSGYNPSSRITLVYRASVTMGNVTCLQWAL